ncbi:MAG: hypothetical protein IPK14_13860 [Blastocatellia bacterium]|nr:hypothetical protein [Blastocatellia bacterium]
MLISPKSIVMLAGTLDLACKMAKSAKSSLLKFMVVTATGLSTGIGLGVVYPP